MRRCRWLRPAILGAALSALLAVTGRAADPELLATPQTVRDFLIQNVCVDAAGGVLLGKTPLDSDCPRQRDLRVGEALPYHKHDHPSPDQHGDAPRGYQRHDSVPLATAGFADLVEHSFDFGAGQGRRFGVFDRGSDGGDAMVMAPGVVSIAATEDAGGFQVFAGECRGAVDAAALTHGWIVVTYDPAHPAPLRGETIARLNDLRSGNQDTCPARFNAAYTAWRVVPFRYRAAPGQGTPVTLTTLVSEHYAGMSPANAAQVERFYFTQELGGTRWESWWNTRGSAEASSQKVQDAARLFAATGRCSPALAPAGGADLVMIDCREWTLLEPPATLAGDPPGFFINALRGRPDIPAAFAAPGGR